MKKRIVAFVCALLLLGSLSAGAVEGEAARAADILTTLNLLDTFPDQDLDAPATRAQAAVLLVELAGAQSAAEHDLDRLPADLQAGNLFGFYM